MGVRSTGSHPTTTKADGHLLEYFRSDMGAGGGASNSVPETASGGTKYTFGGRTIHRFTGTGPFSTSASFNKTCDYTTNI